DPDLPVVLDIDPVDQAELVDIGGNLRIVDGFQRRHDVVRKPRQLILRDRRLDRRDIRPAAETAGRRIACVFHRHPPKNVRARSSASARASTSANVLYMANEARQVEVTPNRLSSGCAQCVPARTATPARSITIETSCAWMPRSSNETIAPLLGAAPNMRR